MLVKCHRVVEVDESWRDLLDEKIFQEWVGHLTADLNTIEEVPVEEAEIEMKNISNYIGSESSLGIYLPSCIIEKPVEVWKWKEQLWIEVEKFRKSLRSG